MLIKRLFRLVLLLAAFSLVAAACGDDDTPSETSDTSADGDTSTTAAGSDEDPTIAIGAQDFGESAILAEIYSQALQAAGYDTDVVSVGGFRDILLAAFDNGEVNFSPEYAASMLEFLNDKAGEATGDADATVAVLQTYLTERGLVALAPAPAIDTNAFVVTDETAAEAGYTKLSDLPADGGGLSLGAPADCETNPFCVPGLQSVYGVDLSAGFTPLEPSLVADALAAGEVEIGVLFSTSARIADEGWVLLEDDENMLAADNVTPVLSQELVDHYGNELTDLVDRISEALTTDELTALNKRFEIDKEDADVIAADFLAAAGLV